MNLNQLRAFYGVIKTGTFSKAAEELNVTEPAVFMQVRSLERYLGYTLLDRFGKELRPTETGEILYEYAKKIFSLVDEATHAVRELQDLKKGFLRLGTARSLAYGLMPIVVSLFQDQYPSIRLFLDENNSQELVESILQRHHELAIVARLPYPDKIETIPFATDEIVLIVSPQSKLAKKETVSWSEAAEDPLVCTGAGSSTQSCIWKEFEKRNMQPVSIIEAGSTEFIIRLVKQGKGHAFLPSTCVKEDIARGELLAVPLNEGNFLFYIDVIYLKGKTLSPAASKFVRFLREIKESPKIERAIGTSFHSLYYD